MVNYPNCVPKFYVLSIESKVQDCTSQNLPSSLRALYHISEYIDIREVLVEDRASSIHHPVGQGGTDTDTVTAHSQTVEENTRGMQALWGQSLEDIEAHNDNYVQDTPFL